MTIADLERAPTDRLEQAWLAFLKHAPRRAVHVAAGAVARTHPLGREPGWHFDAGADDPRAIVRFRRDLWEYYRQRRIDRPVTVRWYDGLRVRTFLGNDLSLCLYVGGSFEPNEFAFLATALGPGTTFIDGGANDGIYSLFAAKRLGGAGTVVAVEPSSREFSRLEENIRLNRLRIDSVKAALGAVPGVANLAVAEEEHQGQNTIGPAVSNPKVATTGHEEVRVTTIDEIVAERQLDSVAVIKLDVEGSEIEALLGASNTLDRHHPLLLVEVEAERLASQNRTKDELRSFLADKGYALYVFDDRTGLLRAAAGDGEPEGNAVAAPAGWQPPR